MAIDTGFNVTGHESAPTSNWFLILRHEIALVPATRGRFDVKNKDSKTVNVSLVEASKVPIKRHIKIKSEATPYDKTYHQYFDKLIAKRKIVMGTATVSN